MKELPYFKFYPNQWITGSIIIYGFRCARRIYEESAATTGAKNVTYTRNQIKTLIPKQWSKLLDSELLKIEDDNIRIKWLDEQHKERFSRT